ncbi:surface lipoprotein assembly modifier [Desulfurispira natronophila]|nr:outer membrane beta-barrel protein [Desulfurispira natronophila]
MASTTKYLHMSIQVFFVALLVILPATTMSQTTQPLPQIDSLRQLAEQQDFQQVYDLLEPLEYEFAGNPAYDSIFGIAALRTGNHGRATWALERLVLLEPENHRGKLSLARAYMELKRYSRTQALINEVRLAEPPPRIMQAADRLELELEERRNPKLWSLTGHIQIGAGYDSNVGSAPGTFIHEVAGPITVDKESSLFSELDLRQRLQYSSTDEWRFFGGYRLRENRPYSASEYLRHRVTIEGGAVRSADLWRLSLEPSVTKSWKDTDEESREARVALNGRYRLNPQLFLMGFATVSRLSYDQNSENNGDFHVAGAGLAKIIDVTGKPLTMTATAYYLTSDQPDSPAGDMRSLGTDVTLSLQLRPGFNLNARLGRIGRDYSCRSHPAGCNSEREDTQWRSSVGGSYQLQDRLRIEPQISHTWQESNMDQNEYERTVFKVSVRYDFATWRR